MIQLLTVVFVSTLVPAAPSVTHKKTNPAPAYSAGIVLKPSDHTKATRLEGYILKINPKAKPYAKKLSMCILAEASRHKLAPEMLAAIAHTESHFRRGCRGKWYERGIFQLWPWGRWLGPGWDAYRAARSYATGYPDVSWKKLGRKLQTMASMDVCISTFLAAHLLAYHMRRCKPTNSRCAAKYNRPAKPRRGYIWALRKRSRAIRRAMNRVAR